MKIKKFKLKLRYEESSYPCTPDEQTIEYAVFKYLKELEKMGMLSNPIIEVKEKKK